MLLTGKCFAPRAVVVACVLGTVFGCQAIARGADDRQAQDALLLEEARAARDAFAPVSQADVALAAVAMSAAADRLDKYLLAHGENGRAWRGYILWDDLKSQLAAEVPIDRETLEKVLSRFRSGAEGLGLPQFRDMRQAISAYLDVSAAAANAESKPLFEAALDEMISALGEVQKNPTADAPYVRLGMALDALERQRMALPLVAKVRARYSQPNFYFVASAAFIDAAASRPIDTTEPVTDVILGTQISGTGRTVGEANMRLIPDPDHAVFEMVVRGVNYSTTIGRNGPARVYAKGETTLVGRMQLVLAGDKLIARPAKTEATTHSRVTGIGSTKRGLIGRIVRRVAQRRIPQQKAQSEAIAARHAEEDFSERLNEEAARMVARANANLLSKVRLPLMYRGEYPEMIKMFTTADALHMAMMHGSVTRLAAPSDPPPVGDKAEVALQLHESLANNYARGLLGGRTLTKTETERLAKEFLGAVPAELVDDERNEEWSITFAEAPVTLRLDDDWINVVVRGDRYTSGARAFDAMNVTARYHIDRSEPVAKLIRDEELEIFPPGFVPGSQQRLSLRQTVLRNLLRRRFGKLMPVVVELADLELEEPWNKISPISLSEIASDDGWLVLGWDRAAGVLPNIARINDAE